MHVCAAYLKDPSMKCNHVFCSFANQSTTYCKLTSPILHFQKTSIHFKTVSKAARAGFSLSKDGCSVFGGVFQLSHQMCSVVAQGIANYSSEHFKHIT